MTNTDEALLDQFRGPGLCESCALPCLQREASHILTKGMGGGSRLDHRLNVLSQCRRCHQGWHDCGVREKRDLMLQAVIGREELNMTPEELLTELYRLQREPNDSVPRLQEGLHPES